jgi:hypothetical protein
VLDQAQPYRLVDVGGVGAAQLEAVDHGHDQRRVPGHQLGPGILLAARGSGHQDIDGPRRHRGILLDTGRRHPTSTP